MSPYNCLVHVSDLWTKTKSMPYHIINTVIMLVEYLQDMDIHVAMFLV